jgi:hypothetical protein
MERRASAILLAACLGVSATGCGLILGISSWQDVSCVDNCSGTDGATDTTMPSPEGGRDSGEAATTDSSTTDVLDASDSGTTEDVVDSATTEAEAASPYHPVTDSTYWTKFDVSSLDGGPKGFAGGAFDGRFVYLAPHDDGMPDGVVSRYDTQSDAGFTAKGAWQTFDTTTVAGGAGAAGFEGAVYDPTHQQVYFVPGNDGTPDGIVATYATSKPFAQASSWQAYAPSVADGGAAGFAGGVMAGSSLILVPSNNGAPDGVAVQYDSTQPFGTGAAWSAFDMTTVKATAKSYFGGVDTGVLVLFAPFGPTGTSGLVTAYAKGQPFTSAGSWQTWQLPALMGGTQAVGFRGAAYDGTRYAYFVPSTNGVAAQFDTQGQFASSAAWAFSPDLTQAPFDARAKGFCGAAFDGRYLYLVPNAGTVLARYDTTGPFTDKASWLTTDLGVGAGPFVGAVFDGEFIYFVPGSNGTSTTGVVARFDARSPPAQVPGLSGSYL